MKQNSIVDASVPNAGRIYDYLLGGRHNFEVDRQAAKQILQLLPFAPKAARLQRWCLQDVAHELTERRNHDVIIDFASGLPTQDHIHYVVPEGTVVIYSDYDPVVVEYAHQILGETANVYFFEADARRPADFLNRPEVQDILRGKRDVAIVYWGISTFLSDEEIVHAAQELYEWSGPSSCWAFNAQGADANPNHPNAQRAAQIYEQMGSKGYPRSKEQYRELIKPWKADSADFVSLLEWHGFEESEMAKEDRETLGPTGAGYGAYLVK